MRFGRQLSEEDLYELKDGDKVLVVNTNDEYAPFIGHIDWVRDLQSLHLAIVDIGTFEDCVEFNDENIMVFSIEEGVI